MSNSYQFVSNRMCEYLEINTVCVCVCVCVCLCVCVCVCVCVFVSLCRRVLSAVNPGKVLCDLKHTRRGLCFKHSVTIIRKLFYNNPSRHNWNKSALIIHYMFQPIWPCSIKYNYIQITWDVNCNITFYEIKYLMFTERAIICKYSWSK
jgi:hypothetical protein